MPTRSVAQCSALGSSLWGYRIGKMSGATRCPEEEHVTDSTTVGLRAYAHPFLSLSLSPTILPLCCPSVAASCLCRPVRCSS
ncbi:unnamed protein product [Protopolystoma xenopodis]|uniref:Uncharacterized protein n=1 Tax=Protopolystoma xenopodis TaxID=117903 RepID=A0A3S5BPC3_9PLAT|nr:unnamed protein product [Protopolystoma xenopodis]